MSGRLWFFALGLVALLGACGNNHKTEGDKTGQLIFHLDGTQQDDVTAFNFEVFDKDGNLVNHRCVPLEPFTLPSRLIPGAGPDHRFSDAFFTLPPANYLAKATPMKDCNTTSRDCAAVEKAVEVNSNKTTEVILVSKCDRPDNGGLDIIAVLNHDPVIDDLVFDPSKFILTCQKLLVTVTVTDPDSDPLTYEWTVITQPPGAIYTFEPNNNQLTFMSKTEGDYEVRITACDTMPDPMCSFLEFPIHVKMSQDNNGNGIGDECDEQDVVWTTPNDFMKGTGDNVKYDVIIGDGEIYINDFNILRTPYLWVPSSAANQVVLFDLTTLLPASAAFPRNTCTDPSRLGQDSEGSVYVTCRGDGGVQKITIDGTLVWSDNLTQICGGPAMRGAAYVPRIGMNDQVYVGCSDSGKTLVLDAITGAVLSTIPTVPVYGLAFDGKHVFVTSIWTNTVQAIDVATNLIVWSKGNSFTPYGIAAHNGQVWVSTWNDPSRIACAFDASNGNLLNCVDIKVGILGRGVGISPIDGMVWVAVTDANKVVRIDPITYAVAEFPSGGIDTMCPNIDSANNIYVVHYTSHNVVKMDSNGNILATFGAPYLSLPYAYSSDLTGINIQFLEAKGEWISNEIDMSIPWGPGWKGLVTLIAWAATTPPNTEVFVDYMVDRDGVWLPAVNGGGLPSAHQYIQFKVRLRSIERNVSPAVEELHLHFLAAP